MKRSPKYIIEEQNKTIKKIKEQILYRASMTNEAFDFPSGKIKTKSGDKRDLLNKYMVEFGLQGTPRTRLMWLLSTAMKELVAEGLMFKRRNTREYKRQRGSVLYFTTMFAYADSEEKLKTVSERLSEISCSYKEKENFISDAIFPNNGSDGSPSLIGKEVIIDKDGVKENYTYRVRVGSGVQEFTRSEKELIKEYAIFGSMDDAIDLLNMRGFEKFQILTGKGGYLNDGNLSDRDELNNKVKVGDRILGMDFMVVILG